MNLRLTTEERLALYEDILAALRRGDAHQAIAQRIVGIINEHIEYKIETAKNLTQDGPVFHRVDD